MDNFGSEKSFGQKYVEYTYKRDISTYEGFIF